MLGISIVTVMAGALGVIAIVLMALAFLSTQLVREIRRRSHQRSAAQLRTLAARESLGLVDADSSATRPLGRWVGVSLLLAFVLQAVGTFVPYEHVRGFTIRLYDSMQWDLVPYVVSVGLVAALGIAALRLRRQRIVAAMIIGYCTLAIGALAFAAVALSDRSSSQSPGAGLSLLAAGDVLQGGAVIGACMSLFSSRRPRSSLTTASLVALVSAIAVGTSAVMAPIRFPGSPLWLYDEFPHGWRVLAVAAFLLVGLVPLVAAHSGRAGFAVALALATHVGLDMIDSLIEHHQVGSFARLSAGFWLQALAMVLLVALAAVISRRDHPRVTTTFNAPVSAAPANVS